MSTKSIPMKQYGETDKATRFDAIKWLLVAFLVVAGIGTNYYYHDVALAFRLLGWVIVAVAAGALAWTTAIGRSFVEFASESRTELRKVVWPSRDETVQTTLMVIAFVVVLSLILWAFDMGLMWTMGIMTGQRG